MCCLHCVESEKTNNFYECNDGGIIHPVDTLMQKYANKSF